MHAPLDRHLITHTRKTYKYVGTAIKPVKKKKEHRNDSEGADLRDTVTENQVQWLSLCASTAGGRGSLSGQGTKIPQVEWHGQKK